MEGDLIKINEWLRPVAWIYGIGVRTRNWLFDVNILKSKSYDMPVISIGNITVGGTGKTPHTEYLVRLLQEHFKVAVLSRGYKRKSKGFVLARPDTPMQDIGDEPYQMKQKFPNIHVAVDKNRCHGIEQLLDNHVAPGTEVVLLDDAFQHRYVKPGLNILLVDYHRLICDDALLPAGRLREPQTGKDRANIVIVTKCPADINPIGFRVIKKALRLYPYQSLYFSTLKYGALTALFGKASIPSGSLGNSRRILLLTGIASPEQMKMDLEHQGLSITPLPFGDHHSFTPADVALVNETFAAMPAGSLIVTTEKDAVRLKDVAGLSEQVRKALYVLPIEVEILRNQQQTFNKSIIDYVLKNPRNSNLAEKQNGHDS